MGGMERANTRWGIVWRLAKRAKSGRILRCTPSRAEATGLVPHLHSAGKIAYPDLATAILAARELEEAGARPMYAYVCARSDSGHSHVATAWNADEYRLRCEQRRAPAVPTPGTVAAFHGKARGAA